MQELAPSMRFVQRIANPDAFADVDADRALMVLLYQEALE
jgi:23S rRNA (cytosine1962-C5)-methyltransferase